MPTWPAYAHMLRDGYTVTRESALQRTEMESGPPKQARVRSRVMVRRAVTVRLATKSDYLAFLAWFSGSIAEGASWFDWPDPVDGQTKPARIVAGEGLQQTVTGQRLGDWRIPLMIETWG